MSICKDSTDSSLISTESFTHSSTPVTYQTLNQSTSSLISTENFAYSPTLQIYQLDKLALNFEKNSIIRFEDPFIQTYGQELFNSSLISFNNFLSAANTNQFLNISVNYPLVQNRLDKGVAITPIEFTEFMEDSGYNPISIGPQQISNPKKVLSLYNSHINGRFSKSTMGTFCELAPTAISAVPRITSCPS